VDKKAPTFSLDNFIQDAIFPANFADMPITQLDKKRQAPKRLRSGKSAIPIAPEVRIPASPSTGGAEIRVIRNTRRSRSISAYREQGAIVIQIPARLPRGQVADLIPEMVQRVLTREARERISDSDLIERAIELMAIHLPEFSERPASVTWRAMNERWGSCTTVDRTIRISERLNGAPSYVIDYVLLHELIHLRIPDHSKGFTDLLERFSEGEKASAFLEGYESGARA
jgi:predicted metal-dependent hydrolase